MSIYRTITRIVPLNDPTFYPPYDFSTVTDNIRNIQVEYFADATTGLNYRLEKVEVFELIKPGETEEAANKAFVEKLNKLNFLPLNCNQVQPEEVNMSVSVPNFVKIDPSQRKDDDAKLSIMKKKSSNLSQLYFKKKYKAKYATMQKSNKKREVKAENEKKYVKNIKRSNGAIDKTVNNGRQTTVGQQFYENLNSQVLAEKNIENTPIGVSLNMLNKAFKNLVINEPEAINLFTSKNQNDKS